MIEFEKWFENYLSKITDKWSCLMVKQMKPLYKFIWQAALEWILNQLDYSEQHKEIADKIEKELESLT